MIKYLSALLMILITASFSNAQNFEGKIHYKMSYGDLGPGMETYEAMLPTEMLYLVKGNKSKMIQPTSMGETIVILDQENKMSTVLVDMMGKKVAIENKGDESNETELPSIDYVNESKTIAGYLSKKAIISDDEGNKTIVWYTEELPSLGLYKKMKGLKGFPMEFEMNQNGISSKISVSKISEESISDSEFIIPSEYEKVSQEEFQQMMMQAK